MEDDRTTTYGVMVDAPGEDSNDNGNQDPPSPDTRAEDMSDDDFDTEIADEIKADVRMFSGCQDKQTSADVHDVTKFGVPNSDGGAGGACTNALLVNKDDEPDSWMSLLKSMRTTLSTKKFKQIPQMATSKKLDIRSPFSLAGGEGGKHRALLIGINYVGDPSAELKGCHNDVAQMKDYIVKHGYPAEEGEDLKIVMDDGEHTAPTRANIIEAIEWLVEGAAPGDSLFMHYSGHGGSVEDTDNNEKDKRDETMIPVDYSVSGHIKDDELLAELVLPLSEGVVLSVVMDCCHSGSILDLPYTFDADEGALQLVDDGGSGIVHKKAKFNMSKVRKARKLNFRGPYMKAIRAKAAAAAAAKAAATKAAAAKAASEKQEQHEEQEQAPEPVGGGTAFKVGSKVAAAAAKARASTATKAVSQQQQEQEQPAANGGTADTANDQPPSEGVAPNAAVKQAPKFKLSIETEVIKSMETGRYIAPDPMAFKSFTSCEAEMEEDGQDDCDLSVFVVTPWSVDEESGREHAAGISMLWVDSESSTGYSMKHLTKGDARFDGKRAVYVEATKGEGEEPFLVAVFAPEDFKPASVGGSSGVAPESTEFVVWVCDKLAHSRDETLNWTACGSFVGTKVKRTSATTSTSGEHLVIVEALDVKDEARVFYGTSLGNDDLQMSMFPTPRAMRASNQQVSTVQASTLEKDGETFAIAMALPAAIPKETAVAGDSSDTSDHETEIRPCMLYAQSLNDPGFYAGSIDIPGDTRCFMTTPAYGLNTDVYVAGTKKVIWYDDRSWDGSTGKAGVCLNAVDFTSPAKEMRTMIDKQFIRHVFILLESGKLLYTSQDPEEGSKFDEPVDILPNVEAFSCHADSVGNVHVNNINKDGNLMHHMMDQGTSLWMQKEVMVSGGAAREHLISVVDLKVTALEKTSGKKTANDLMQAAEAEADLPAISLSCGSGAIFRINGKGHLMHKDKKVEVRPNMSGLVRIGQFVDSFSVPHVTIRMPGLDRPLEIMCGNILTKKLEKMDASALKGAKSRDAMGDDAESLIDDPDDGDLNDFVEAVAQLAKGFKVLSPTEFPKKNDVDGIFRLTGRAFNEENQFVAFVDEGPAFEDEEVGDGPPSPGGAPGPLQGGAGAEPIGGELKEMATPQRRTSVFRGDSALHGRGPVVRRFTKHRCAPDPFGMGHLGVERVRRVECRNMGNLAKKARENADEAIYETKKHAAEALRAKLSNAERAQEQATEYAAEATKWAGEAKQAAEAVRWTQAAVEAAEAAVKASEEVEMKASQDIGEIKAAQTFGARKASQESQVDIILGVEGPDEEAARAMEAAARAVEAAGVAQQKSEQAKAMEKLHGSDGQLVDLSDFEAGGYLSAEYSRDHFFGPVAKKLWLAAEAKRVGARPGRGSSHLPVRAGHGQSPAWSGRSPGYHGRSPAIAARYRQPAVSTPAHSDVLKAVEAAGQAVETAAQAMERAEQAKEALGDDTGEPERKGGDPDDSNPRDFGSAESSNKGFFDSIANELRELADEAKREAEKEVAQAAHGPPGYTSSGLFGSETMEAGIPTRRPITDTTAECLKDPRWEAVRQETAKTAMEAARLVKAAQTAAFELQAVEEVEAAEALDSEEDLGEEEIDGHDGAYGSTEYTSRKFGSRIKKATKKVKSGVQNAAKKTKEAAQTAARKAEEAAKQASSFAKREAERIAKDAARKAEAEALKAKREAEKAAKAVDQAAKDIKKAGELVAKEVVDKAQIAAAGAKQAAEGAAKLAEKAVNEVGDVAGDIKDGVEDVADKVKDGVVHAADKVKDVAKDAAEVVGDVTMKMVDVVEEVVEEVWEHTPEGLKKVARKVAKVVKKGVDLMVKIGKVVYHFVETKLEQLVKALDWLWDKIKTGIMKAIEWLASFFKYKEILKTAEILEAGAIYGIDQFIATIPSEEAVKEFFNDLRLMLERKTGLDLDAQDMSTEDTTPDDREVDPKENFIQHHTTCGTFDDAGTPTDTKDDSKDKGKSSEDSDDDDPGMDTVAQKLNFLYEKLKEGLNAFMSALAEGIVDLLEGGTQLMVKILKFVAKKFRDWLADGGPIYIPVISEIYKLITGRKLKLAKALFFIFAIPVTYMTKAILGRWPSQVVSVDQLTGAKGSTLSIAGQEPDSTDADAPAHLTRSLPGDDSSSEFVYTSRSGESEEKPGTDFQKSIWAVLKMASIAMSGVTIPCQAMVTITTIPAGDRKFLTKRFAKSHPIFKIISYGRALQKILNLASTMVYVGDYFTGPKTPLKRKDKTFFSFLTMFDAAGVLISLNVDGGQASAPGAGGLANMDTTGGGQPPKNATAPAIIFDIADGIAEIARGSRLIALAKELDEGGRQERTMKFQGSHGIFKGASQIATAFGKQIVKSAADPFTKVTVVIVAASLKWITKVPLGIASVVLQLEGSAEGKDDDEDLKNNAYWIACFAYL
ncbi:unnamed protein product [Ectocarpus sp. CCAP 1310/34]|nr:unnamed protein product [Ectocarpus sp. CCAP 1310/34]